MQCLISISLSLQTLQCLFISIYFYNSILFWWISVISLNFFCLIMIVLTRYIKDPLEILGSMFYHKSHYQQSHYQHSIGNDIGTAKTLLFENYLYIYIYIYIYIYTYFWKIEHIFFLLFSYSTSISLWYNYSFLHNPPHWILAPSLEGRVPAPILPPDWWPTYLNFHHQNFTLLPHFWSTAEDTALMYLRAT